MTKAERLREAKMQEWSAGVQVETLKAKLLVARRKLVGARFEVRRIEAEEEQDAKTGTGTR